MNPVTPTPLQPDEQEKLRELTTQSWNLELAISGVAMFAILQLPDLLDSAFANLQYNHSINTKGFAGLLPPLAYSMIRTALNILFVAFLANFVMRAFWVGLVGLLAVYPSGIHYDRMPFSTPQIQQRMAEELGPLDRYILWLDKRCNIVFALAFQFVFFLILVSLLYVLSLAFYLLVQPNVPAAVWTNIKIGVGVLVGIFYVAIIVLSLKKVKETPTGAQWHYRFTRGTQLAMKIIMLGMYRHSSYVTNTFYSHIPQQRFARTALIFISVFFVAFFIEYINDQTRNDRRVSFFNSRHLYSSRVDSLFVDPAAYDNQRPEGEYVSVASIQADVIREPYLRLFIAYPKALDTLLTRLAPEPVWLDTLSRPERRRPRGIWSSQQINQLIRLTVNDSIMARPELLFTRAGTLQQRGWQTVLVPGNLVTGRNLLRVGINRPGQPTPDELIAIPFWYVPEP
ncbi:hypothetical protein J2I47_02060 [Fibrella sp. HMF5335]|uniref:Uncharacterized protein n=1 Tax=Fibrella rubiginis TaxID=2817060 RepID=A0A939GDN9_9BACT|nr:hypothetical protein [Fibrella rubiginis]MBO0935324.1 hypothetical protein [Fibrella rubiginis]